MAFLYPKPVDPNMTRSDIRKKMRNIEALLKEAETPQDVAQEYKYVQKIGKLMSEASSGICFTKLFWKKPGPLAPVDEKEYDTLMASLDHGHYRLQMEHETQLEVINEQARRECRALHGNLGDNQPGAKTPPAQALERKPARSPVPPS